MKKNVFVRSVRLVLRDEPRIFMMLPVCALLDAAFPYIGIIFSARLLTELTLGKDPGMLFFYAGMLAGLTFIGMLLKNAAGQYLDVLYYIEMKRIVQSICEKSWRLDYSMFSDNALRNRIQSMSDWIYWQGPIAAVQKLQGMIRHILSLLASIAIMVTLVTARAQGDDIIASCLNSFMFAAVFLVGFAIRTVVLIRNDIKTNALGAEITRKKEKHIGRFYDLVWASCGDYKRGKDIRVFSAADLLLDRIGQTLGEVKRLDIKSRTSEAKKDIFGDITEAVFSLAVYLLMGLKAFYRAFGIGSLIEYTGMVSQFSSSVSGMISVFADFIANTQYLNMYFEFMDMKECEANGTKIPEIKDGISLEIKDVTFTYPGTQSPALKEVSLTIGRREKVAFIGTNGSGKSTLVKLICGLYRPDSGQICLNGVPIDEYDRSRYRRLISAIFQDYSLFAFSLGENVSANSEYDSVRAEKALKMANFGRRYADLKDGLETPVSVYMDDNGIELSGGEEQKVAIARCHYKDAPFVIADEPTAALDPISEAGIYSNLFENVRDKTGIFISHRLSSCKMCDRIAVFDKGRLVEFGSHEELSSAGGLYEKMWNAQAGYYV